MPIDYPVKKEPTGGTEYGNSGIPIEDVSHKVDYGKIDTNDASQGGAKQFEPHPGKPEQYKTDTLKVTK